MDYFRGQKTRLKVHSGTIKLFFKKIFGVPQKIIFYLRESSFSCDSHDGIGDSERILAPSGCPLRAIGTVCSAPGMPWGVGAAVCVVITGEIWD